MDFKGVWHKYLPMIEFSYNNSYQATIDMALYEVLYRIRCRSAIHWYEARERYIATPEFIEEATEAEKIIK